MSRSEAEAVRETGRLRGGWPGETYWTDEVYTSAEHAQQRLALSERPEVRMEFRIRNNPRLEIDAGRVEPAHGREGEGREYMSEDPVEVEVIDVQPIH